MHRAEERIVQTTQAMSLGFNDSGQGVKSALGAPGLCDLNGSTITGYLTIVIRGGCEKGPTGFDLDQTVALSGFVSVAGRWIRAVQNY